MYLTKCPTKQTKDRYEFLWHWCCIVQCMFYGRWRSRRSWRTDLLVVVEWRVVGVYVNETSVWQGQMYLRRRRRLAQTWRCRRIGESLLAYRLKIRPDKNHALHYISARHVCVPGNVNGVNVIGLALQGPSVPGLQLINSGSGRPPSNLDIGYTYQHPLQARGPTREYATNKGKPGSIKLTNVVWKCWWWNQIFTTFTWLFISFYALLGAFAKVQ